MCIYNMAEALNQQSFQHDFFPFHQHLPVKRLSNPRAVPWHVAQCPPPEAPRYCSCQKLMPVNRRNSQAPKDLENLLING